MEYVLLVNCRVKTPVHTLTSSRPPVIWPLPSAVKLPARVKGVLNPPHSSVQAIKKAYCPFKLALEKFPVGGGGGGPTIAVLLPHAAQKEATRIVASGKKRLMERFIAHLPVVGFLADPRHGRQQRRAVCPSQFAGSGIARPFGSREQGRRFPPARRNSLPRPSLSHPLLERSCSPEDRRPRRDGDQQRHLQSV